MSRVNLSPQDSVLVAEGLWGPAYDQLADSYEIRALDRPATAADLRDSSAMVVRNLTRVDRAMLAGSSIRVIARAGTGLDNIDLAAADDAGVVVIAAPGANSISVAEHAIGLALAVARRTTELDRLVREGGWQRPAGKELAGATWGLLSAGATGRATGRLAAAFGMSVLAYDPYCDPNDRDLRRHNIMLRPLEEVVSNADVLSIHLPATPETVGMVDARLLALAKPGLILINVGRGDVLDESAVATALREGRLAGAGLDVRAEEPPAVNRDTGLESLPNVVLTPHIGGITVASQGRIAETLCAGIIAVLSGGAAATAVGRHRSAVGGGVVITGW